MANNKLVISKTTYTINKQTNQRSYNKHRQNKDRPTATTKSKQYTHWTREYMYHFFSFLFFSFHFFSILYSELRTFFYFPSYVIAFVNTASWTRADDVKSNVPPERFATYTDKGNLEQGNATQTQEGLG